MPIVPSPEIWHRDDFPLLCNWRKLWRAVEVGVDRGEFASMFLSRWMGSQYWGVDSYQPYPEQQFDRDADYQMAIHRFERHGCRAKLLRHPSADAAVFFPIGSVDFVYIDGAHDYESVRADLEAWRPKLSRQGILAGHDWDNHPAHAGVRRAVSEFAEQGGFTVYLTKVDGYQAEECPSWYTYVSGMPGPRWRRC
jgi:hypothetical protein